MTVQPDALKPSTSSICIKLEKGFFFLYPNWVILRNYVYEANKQTYNQMANHSCESYVVLLIG